MFQLGEKVMLVKHPEFADGITGVVCEPTDYQIAMAGNDQWQGLRRKAKGRERYIYFYHVQFDSPQDDGSGDGPYAGAEVDENYLKSLDVMK